MEWNLPQGYLMKNLQEAINNPSSVFSDPEEVLNHPEFTLQERVRILSQWKDDRLQLQVAEAEGMAGAGKAPLMDRILAALQELSGELDPALSSPE